MLCPKVAWLMYGIYLSCRVPTARSGLARNYRGISRMAIGGGS
jgi:hypothetical protein